MKFSLLPFVFLSQLLHLSLGLLATPYSSLVTRRTYPEFYNPSLQLFNGDDEGKDEATIEEEARIGIWTARRGQIRWALRSAEAIRNVRISNGWVPDLDEEGNPIKSGGKFALTATAFVVAAGAVALRIGGRAALVGAVGLDFLTDNPELQSQMNQVLTFSETMDPILRLALFCLAWTAVKVSCFDAGGVVLALSSGILFGGVLQGAVVSAFGATVGSSVAFTLAKLDTPIRTKALEVVEENPALKGIERVVADEGLKAILTLRLAPVLPIPIGLYNYVYGVTNVPYLDFAGGVFLGSLKPYLLDSYLGYFGKEVIDGTAGKDGGLQDILLLVALGFSVLIGVFASQLAGETWEAVLEEEESARNKKLLESGEPAEEETDGIIREIMGTELPNWVVGFQLAIQDADYRINSLILQEFSAKVWNYTNSKGDNPIPREIDPALNAGGPELSGAYGGIDMGAFTCDGLVLSPALFSVGLKIADPLFDEAKFIESMEEDLRGMHGSRVQSTLNTKPTPSEKLPVIVAKGEMVNRLQLIRDRTVARLDELNEIGSIDGSTQTR